LGGNGGINGVAALLHNVSANLAGQRMSRHNHSRVGNKARYPFFLWAAGSEHQYRQKQADAFHQVIVCYKLIKVLINRKLGYNTWDYAKKRRHG
jgi:hypothetical protein